MSNVTSRVYISGGTIAGPVSGTKAALTAFSGGNSIAYANIAQNDSVGLAAIGLNVLYAYADGTFEAVAGGNMELLSLDVRVGYVSKATAYTGASSFSGNIASLDVNLAIADSGTVATAGVIGGFLYEVYTDGVNNYYTKDNGATFVNAALAQVTDSSILSKLTPVMTQKTVSTARSETETVTYDEYQKPTAFLYTADGGKTWYTYYAGVLTPYYGGMRDYKQSVAGDDANTAIKQNISGTDYLRYERDNACLYTPDGGQTWYTYQDATLTQYSGSTTGYSAGKTGIVLTLANESAQEKVYTVYAKAGELEKTNRITLEALSHSTPGSVEINGKTYQVYVYGGSTYYVIDSSIYLYGDTQYLYKNEGTYYHLVNGRMEQVDSASGYLPVMERVSARFGGTIHVTGDIDVTANGTGDAIAGVQAPSVSLSAVDIAANVVVAALSGVQEAYLRDADITVSLASEVNVISEYNKIVSGGAEHGAWATIGNSDVNASLVSVVANSAIATSDAKVRAYTRGVSVSGYMGKLNVQVSGSSLATAKVESGSSVSYVGIGLVALFAYAKGCFEAYVDTNGYDTCGNVIGSSGVRTYSIAIDTHYTARANAVVSSPTGGVNAGVYGFNVNLGVAIVTTSALAGIKGGGIVGTYATQSITVNATGDTNAAAAVETPTLSAKAVSVAANVIVAILRSSQLALIENVTIEQAKSVSVASNLNVSDDQDHPGATAYLGGTGAAIGLLNATASVAIAKNDARGLARTQNITIGSSAVPATLSVTSNGHAYAKADIVQPDGVGLVTLTLNVLYAYANGRFDALAGFADGGSYLNNLTVAADYEAYAEAYTGSGTVDVAAASISVNVAYAETGTIVNVGLIGGTLHYSGSADLSIAADGEGKAYAGVRAAVVSLTGIDVAANVVVAKLTAEQNVYIQDTDIITSGNVSVLSTYNQNSTKLKNTPCGAVADITSPDMSAKLAGIQVNSATAVTDAKVRAFTQASSITAHNLTIKATGKSIAVPTYTQSSATLGAVLLGVVALYGDSAGLFEAYADVSGNNTIAVNTLDIDADYAASSDVTLTVPEGGVQASLISGTTNIGYAHVTTNANAGVKGNGTVSASSIDVLAKGVATAYAIVQTPNASLSYIKVTANVIIAAAEAVQEASLRDATLQCGNVSVVSKINELSSEATPAALAKLGGTGSGITLSMYSAETSSATATNNVTGRAVVENITIPQGYTNNTLTVQSYGNSYAVADIVQQSDVGLATVTVNAVYANANGTFEALLGVNDVYVQTLNLLVDYQAKSIAHTGVGSCNVQISALSISTNVAVAKTNVSAAAGLTGGNTYNVYTNGTSYLYQPVRGSGWYTLAGNRMTPYTETVNAALFTRTGTTIRTGGTIHFTGTSANRTVSAAGNVYALAGETAPIAVLDAISVAASVIIAELNSVQSAFTENLTIDLPNANGTFTVKSILNMDDGVLNIYPHSGKGGATAYVGASDVSVKLLGVTVSSATAKANAACNAYIAGTVIGKGDISVLSQGASIADATIGNGSSAEFIGVGVAHVSAEAAGSFNAYIDTDVCDSAGTAMSTVVMTPDDVQVNTFYYSAARASVGSPDGGVTLTGSAYSAEVNIAQSDVTTQAVAAILGGGSIGSESASAGVITVQAQGYTMSLAEVASSSISFSGVNIAANVLNASLNSLQRALIQNAGVYANSVTITSKLNDTTYCIDTDSLNLTKTAGSGTRYGGAYAIHGGNGYSFTLVSQQANTATATSNAKGYAYTDSAMTKISGTLTVTSQGVSRALAETLSGTTFNFIAAGAAVMTATASGEFRAYVKSGKGNRIAAKNIVISVNYGTETRAETAQTGVSVGVASVNVNMATADTTTFAFAGIDGDGTGSVDATGDDATDGISISVTGNVKSIATVRENTSVNLVNCAVNVLSASLNSTQSAAIQNTTIGKAGNININSYLNVNPTQADTGVIDNGSYGSPTATMVSGGRFAGVSVGINKTTAVNNAKGYAYIKDAAIGGASERSRIKINSYGCSTANASVSAGSTASLVGVGVNDIKSDASGVFDAYIDTAYAIYATSVDVKTLYTAGSTAVVSDGAVNVELISIKVNKASSDTTSESSAYIKGNGRLNTTDIVNVVSTGKVFSTAYFRKPDFTLSGLKVAYNEISANLHSTQSAFIDLASLITGGKAVNITASYNADKSKDNPSAWAYLGDTNGSVGLASANVHTLSAIDQSVVTAYYNARADLLHANSYTGAMTITAEGKSYALAGSKVTGGSTSFSLNLLNFGSIQATAVASGSFNAYAGADAYAVATLASLTINAPYEVYAFAYCAAPSLGASLVDIGINQANATVCGIYKDTALQNYNSDIGLRSGVGGGNGTIHVSLGDVNITASGKTGAEAIVFCSEITVAVVGVKSSTAVSLMQLAQRAVIGGTNLVMDGNGNVKVESKVGSEIEPVMAYSRVGSSYGAHLSLVNVGTNESYAYAYAENYAAIIGGSIETAGSVKVIASTYSNASAESVGTFSTSFVSVGELYAEADSSNITIANITGAQIKAGSVDIDANGNTVCRTYSGVPGTIGAVSVNKKQGIAVIGSTNNTKQNTVKAYVGNEADIISIGKVSIIAYNTGDVKMEVKNGFGINAVSVNNASLTSYAYMLTEAGVYSGATVTTTSKNGDVEIYAHDYLHEYEYVGGSGNVSLLGSLDNTYAENNGNQKVTIKIDGTIAAMGSVYLHTDSDVYQYARTNSVNIGIVFSDTKVKAYNNLTRTVEIDIKSTATVLADYGSLTLLARSGQSDNIYCTVKGSSGGLVAISDATIKNTFNETTQVNIEGGAIITNTFGTVTISAIGGNAGNAAYLDFSGIGLGSDTDVKTDVTSNNTVQVNIAAADSATAVITGKNVNISVTMGALDVESNCRGKSSGLYAESTVYAYVTSNIYTDLNIGKAYIAAYDDMNLISNSTPTSSGDNLSAVSYSRVTGLFGYVLSHSRVSGQGKSSMVFTSNTDIVGDDVIITLIKFAGRVNIRATGVRRALAKKDVYEDAYFTRPVYGNIASATYHIGDAAAGIAIDIASDGTTRSVGLKTDYDGTQIVTSIPTLSNNLGGTLMVRGLALSASTLVYSVQYVPYVTITIHRADNAQITIGMIDIYNETVIRALVFNTQANIQTVSESKTPAITITNYTSGDIRLSGLIGNENGSVTIEWVGQTGGALSGDPVVRSLAIGEPSVAPIWANSLTITNATTIGTALTPLSVYFNAYEPSTGTFIDPTVAISASGDINVQLTIVDIELVASLSDVSTSAVPGSLRLNNITSSGGDIRIDLPVAMRLDYTAAGSSYVMCVPGSFQLTSDMVNTNGITLSLTDLVKFKMSQSETMRRVELSRNGIVYYGYVLDLGDGTSAYLYATSGSSTYYTLDEATASLTEYTGTVTADALSEWKNTSSETIYLLPNGATLYITNGRVSRLTAYAAGSDGAEFLANLYGYDSSTNSLLLEDGLVRLDLDTGIITLSPDYEGDYLWYLRYNNGWQIGADSTISSKGTYDIFKLTSLNPDTYTESSLNGQNWFTQVVGAYTYSFDFVYPQTNYLVTRPDGAYFQAVATVLGDEAAQNYVLVTRTQGSVTELVGLYPLVRTSCFGNTVAAYYLEEAVGMTSEITSSTSDDTYDYRSYVEYYTITQYRYYTTAITDTIYSLCTTYTFKYEYHVTQIQRAEKGTSNFVNYGDPVSSTNTWTIPTSYDRSFALLTANTTGATNNAVVANIKSAVQYDCNASTLLINYVLYHYYTSSWPEELRKMGLLYHIEFTGTNPAASAVSYSAKMLGLGSAIDLQHWDEIVAQNEETVSRSTVYGYTIEIGSAELRAGNPDIRLLTRKIYVNVEYEYAFGGQTYRVEIISSDAEATNEVHQAAGTVIPVRNLDLYRQIYTLADIQYGVIAMNAADSRTSAQISTSASGEYFISPLVVKTGVNGTLFVSPSVSIVKDTGVLKSTAYGNIVSGDEVSGYTYSITDAVQFTLNIATGVLQCA